MATNLRAFALVSALFLAACGGGGGGSGTSAAPAAGPQAVTITEANAKPSAASALDAAQNTSATGSATGLPVAVQVDASAGTPTSLQLIAGSARFAASSFSALALPTGVTVSQTVNCTYGGTATVSGQVANSSGLSAGDALTLSMTGCSETSGTSLSGQLSMMIVSGSLTAIPFHVVITTTATNLTATFGGTTVVANGTVTLDWTGSATSETLVASGAAMSTRETVSGVTHTTTLRNFTQSLTISGSTLTSGLSATVETDSSRLGSGTFTYTITTPAPVVWSATTRTATSGVLKVVGANNSQLVATINADGSVTIQIDANGDGTFEKTITSTTAELAGLV